MATKVAESYGEPVIRSDKFGRNEDAFGGADRGAAIAEYKRIIDAHEKAIQWENATATRKGGGLQIIGAGSA